MKTGDLEHVFDNITCARYNCFPELLLDIFELPVLKKLGKLIPHMLQSLLLHIFLFSDRLLRIRWTKKFIEFVNNPIGDEPVECLPGIGSIFGKRLLDEGFGNASQVLEKFLEFDRDEELFTDWLGKICRRSSNHWQMIECYDGLNEWYRHFESKCISSYSIMFSTKLFNLSISDKEDKEYQYNLLPRYRQTKKFFEFVNNPIGNKPVECLPGTGTVFGQRLRDKGFKYASQVLGCFLEFYRDEAWFTDWLKKTCECEPRNYWLMIECYDALNEWYRNNLELSS